MASSVSRQDESNPALWLATRAGKMELSCLLETTRHKKNFRESHITSLFSQDGWILASFFFCEFMDLNSVSVHKHTHTKKELGQYPAILNSHLVHNPYILQSIALTAKCTSIRQDFFLQHWYFKNDSRGKRTFRVHIFETPKYPISSKLLKILHISQLLLLSYTSLQPCFYRIAEKVVTVWVNLKNRLYGRKIDK